MSRTSFLALAVAVTLFAPTSECQAQLGFVNSGGRVNASPILTNGNTYARMGISTGVSQLVDVFTFTPVRGFPLILPPANPTGSGTGRAGFNPGLSLIHI